MTSGSCGTKYSNGLKVPTYPPSFSGAFTAGSINGTKTICYNASAGTLGNASSAEWGNEPASSINYQWQVSSNNSSWSNISGATGSTYSPGNLTATRWYRRRALTVACGISAYTSSVKVTVVGVPTPVLQNISPGCGQATITVEDPNPSTGIGYNVWWQDTADGMFQSQTGSNAGLSRTVSSNGTYYARIYQFHDGCWGPALAINVNEVQSDDLVPGVISSDVPKTCFEAPFTLTSELPTGGAGNYDYQWQENLYLSGWTDIPGATALSYTVGSNYSREYRLEITSGVCDPMYSSVIKVPTYPPGVSDGGFTAGSINGAKTICYNSSAGTLGNASSAEWGNEPTSSINYQWQVSSNNSSWSNISGATGSTYSPGNLTATRWYRRRALTVACGISAYTSSVKVTVVSVPTPVLQNISPGCGQATITLEDPNPSTGIGYNVWWQDTADGTFQSQTGSNAGLSRTVSSNGIYYARIYQFHDGCWGPALAINVNEVQSDDLVPGVISSNVPKTCFEAPFTLTSELPTGGTGNYDYQWQENLYLSGWTDIPGATALSYTVGSNYSREYRLEITSGVCDPKYSSVIDVPTYPPGHSGGFDPGTISGPSMLCYSTSPGELGTYGTAATWGNEPASLIDYQWEVSTDGASWSEITGETNETLDLSSETLTSDRWYRRRAETIVCGIADETLELHIQVANEPLLPQPISISRTCTPGIFKLKSRSQQHGYVLTWQDISDGKEIKPGDSNVTNGLEITASGTYYARTYFEYLGCWSEVVSYTVDVASLDLSTIPFDKNCNAPPSLNRNFVRVETPHVEVSGELDLSYLTSEEKAMTYTYIDGLGREEQIIQVHGSPSHADILQPIIYDNSGRKPIEYLPYTNNGYGAYRSNSIAQQIDFYGSATKIDHDIRPFTEHTFDNSPLNRVLSSYLPGSQWKVDGKDVENYFEVNIANEVRFWTVTGGLPSSTSFYGANQLWVSEIIGEDDQVVKEYTNGRDQLILSRVKKDGSTWYDTYYIYDDFGNLRFVIPPKLVATDITPDMKLVRALAFEYRYDERQRVIEKYIPGAIDPDNPEVGEPVYIIYDQWDRQVMTQDGLQRAKSPKEWTYTKYDNFNRPIVTGITTSNLSRPSLQSNVDGHNGRFETTSANKVGYTLGQTYPLNPDINEVLTVTFYDNYLFKDASWSDLNFSNEPGFDSNQNTKVKGQVTGSQVRGLEGSWLRSVTYYDHKYRVIQSHSENHLNGTDRVINKYDFIGNMTKSKIHHTSDSENITILYEYEYDHANRLLREYNTIDNESRILLVENEYNELGEIVERNLHSTNSSSSFLQSVDQRYNIRGWLTDINHHKLANDGMINDDSNDLFGMRLSYNKDQYTVNSNALTKQYSGNIAGAKWSTDNLVDPTEEQGYVYDYDLVNRLEIATYGKNTGSDSNFGGDQFYTVDLSYDENGNIVSLDRNGKHEGALVPLDKLVYTYEDNNKSNRLYRVVDSGEDDKGFKEDSGIPGRVYYYDQNGNLTADVYKEITDISYNHLNLPTLITFYDGRSVKYEYDGVGTKLRKTVMQTDGSEPSITDYLGLGQYKESELEFLFTSEGRAVKYTQEFNYEYFLKDHLGNTRVTFGNLPERKEYLATMETENSSYEESEFTFPSHPNIRTNPTANVQNHTPLGNESVALNGMDNGREVGPAKVLNIATGDRVEIEVWAKYVDTGWSNTSIPDIISVLTSAFGVASTGSGAEGASAAFQDALSLGSPGIYSGNVVGQPDAYLQYIFFDASYAYIDEATVSNFQLVGSASNGSFAKLSSGTLTFDEPGYLLIYVVNESNQNKNVFFDDLKIVHESAALNLKVSQSQDYYPFGGSFNEYSYGLDNENKYLFNGNERQPELGWDDFNARMYDPALGRFMSIDPLADEPEQIGLTPYQYAWNNPATLNDPSGECPACWARLLQMAQRARPALQRGSQWVQRNGARAGRAIQAGWNSAHRSVYYSNTSQWMRASQNWVATNIQGATSYFYRNSQLVGEAGAFIASAVDPNPAANYSIGAGDELGNAVGAALRKGSGVVLDFFGGARSAIKNGVSIDPKAVSGFRGTIAEFAEQFSGSKVGEIVANNPQATFMKEAAGLLESGGKLTVRGTMSNKFFNKIANGKGLEGFEVVQDATKISNEGFKKTDGSAIQGQMFELILKRTE